MTRLEGAEATTAQALASVKELDRVAFQNMLACSVLNKTMEQQQQGGGAPEAAEAVAAVVATGKSSSSSPLGMTVTYDFTALSCFPAMGVKR